MVFNNPTTRKHLDIAKVKFPNKCDLTEKEFVNVKKE